MVDGLIRVAKRTCLHDNCWCAWCKVCGEKLTHCDFTEQDARDLALGSDHACLRHPDPQGG